MSAILKHELSIYYHSMTAYIFGAFLLIFTGLGALIYNINASVANFEYVLNFISIVFVIIVPILTMKVIADEKRQRTDQLLYALPITTTDVVLGKFFALLVVYGIPMIIICLYPLIFALFGDVYLPTSYGCIVAFFFMGAALIAIGVFISSLVESQGIAAGLGVVVILFNYYSVTLANYVSSSAVGTLILIVVLAVIIALILRALTGSDIVGMAVAAVIIVAAAILFILRQTLLEGILPSIMKELSLFNHFSTFVNGMFSLTDIVFYLSVIIFFLFMTVQSLEKRRYS